ncbi:unnamed protein product, partial [Polarella glacialis]
FHDKFSYLFDVYRDVSTAFLGDGAPPGGHMTIAAFVRFCIDVQIFPNLIDFNSLLCIFRSAESVGDIFRSDLKQCMVKDPSESKFQPGDVVQLVKNATADSVFGPHEIRVGEPLKVVGIDVSDIDSEAVRVMTTKGKKHWIRLDAVVSADRPFEIRLPRKRQTINESAQKAVWVNKSFEDMCEVEKRSLFILSSFAEYLEKRKLRSKDFFTKFDESSDGTIDADELFQGIVFMCLGGNIRTSITTTLPSKEEVGSLFSLIDHDGGGTIDYAELDTVLKTVTERMARNAKGENIFLKDITEMTPGELAAEKFFVPLFEKLEQKGKKVFATVRSAYSKFYQNSTEEQALVNKAPASRSRAAAPESSSSKSGDFWEPSRRQLEDFQRCFAEWSAQGRGKLREIDFRSFLLQIGVELTPAQARCLWSDVAAEGVCLLSYDEALLAFRQVMEAPVQFRKAPAAAPPRQTPAEALATSAAEQ